jgi:hypothetical protein
VRDGIDGGLELAGSARELGKSTEEFAEGAQRGQKALQVANQELARSIRLGFRLGETLARAFKKGDVEAQKLLGKVLQIVGSAVGIANPAVGTVISGAGGLIGSFDEGGYTGSGPPTQPAGVVHAGEYVRDAETTQRVGVPALQAIQEGTMTVTAAQLEAMAGVKGFAEGGFVGAVTQPARSVGNDESGSSSSTELIREVRQLRDEVSEQTDRLESVERRVVVSRRTSRGIVDEGTEYRRQKRTTERTQ